jgi:hypothetical protein
VFFQSEAQVVIPDGVIQRGIVVPATPGYVDMTYNLAVTRNATRFVAFPCFGRYDWCVNSGSPPNFQEPWNNTCCLSWVTGLSKSTCGAYYATPRTYYFTMRGLVGQSWSADPEKAAVFDFLVYDNATGLLDVILPIPGNDGVLVPTVVQPSSRRAPMTIVIQFTGTTNPLDTYTLWRYDGIITQNSDTGYLLTACGVERYMTVVDPSLIEMTQNGNEFTISASGFDQEASVTLAVVVERPNGYKAAYASVLVNSASFIVPSFFMVLVMAFAVLFM